MTQKNKASLWLSKMFLGVLAVISIVFLITGLGEFAYPFMPSIIETKAVETYPPMVVHFGAGMLSMFAILGVPLFMYDLAVLLSRLGASVLQAIASFAATKSARD